MEEILIPHKEWSISLRLNHWIMAAAIVVLIATGFYIAHPLTLLGGETSQKFFMGYVRAVHLFFGVILVFTLIWRIYLAFFSRFHADWKDFFAWIDFKELRHQIRYYLFIEKEAPEHKRLYGPLQSLAYASLLGMVSFMCLTGLILAGAGYASGWFGTVHAIVKQAEYILGGLAVIRLLHHVLTWGFVLFILVHVYMAFWYDVMLKGGIVSSMISGVVYRKKH